MTTSPYRSVLAAVMKMGPPADLDTRFVPMRSFLSFPSFFFMCGAVMATKLHRGAGRKDGAMKRYFGLAMAAGILAGSMHMSADKAISITVRPAVTSFRGNAQLKVLVSRNEKNRVLMWEVDGPNYYRSSSIELDGAASPRSYFFMVKDLPAGEFDVRATVKRNDSSVAMDRSTIKVVGGPS
jgi:hypothetical protein